MRATLCTLAALALLAGCGSGSDRLSHGAYEQKLQSIGVDVKDALTGPSVDNSKKPSEIADQIEALRPRLERAADDVDDLSPPDDAETANDELARALHQFDSGFASLADSVRTTDIAGTRDATKRLQEAATLARIAVTSLETKGYDLGAFGSQ